MTNLKQVITSILRDVVQAQHEANLYAQELASQSAGRGSVIPLAHVGELTMGIRYAVLDGEDVTEVKVPNIKANHRIASRLSEQLARLILRKLTHEVRQSGIAYRANGFSYIDDLGDNQELTAYIAQRMLSSLKDNTDKLYNEEQQLEVEAIADLVLAVGEQYVLRHSEIEGLFTLPGGATLLGSIRRVLDHEVSDSIRQIIDEEQTTELFEARTERSLRIEIGADKLRDYPAEAIQSVTLRVVPTVAPEARP